MSSAALTLDQDIWKPKYNPWLIAVVVSLAAFMEVLDTSIANVALPSFGQKTRRGQSPTEQSRFLLLINVSASVAFNELVVEPLYDLGPIEELCNQGENPKQNHHCHASRA